jgi:hypothetical protein
MKPIDFPESNATLAKEQPEYIPLPVHRSADGIVTSCWQFTWLERIKILFGGRIWLSQMTFGKLLQPQKPQVDWPFAAVPSLLDPKPPKGGIPILRHPPQGGSGTARVRA